MDDATKWIGFSRSLWSMLLPIVVLVLNQYGITNAESIGDSASNVVNAGLIGAAGVLQFMHQVNPKPTRLGAAK